MDDVKVVVGVVGLGISAIAFVLSLGTATFARRVRQADAFSRLYDQLNTRDFGRDMRCVGEWGTALREQLGDRGQEPSKTAVMFAYRGYLRAEFPMGSMADKDDSLEDARRTVKAWYIKCYLTYKFRDLSRRRLFDLITEDRAPLMRLVFNMTREQAAFWKKKDHDPTAEWASDEPWFQALERLTRRRTLRHAVVDFVLRR